MLKKHIKQILPRTLIQECRSLYHQIIFSKLFVWLHKGFVPISKELKRKRKFFICGTPVHSNLGDHGIIEAERHFLRKHFPDYLIIEVPTHLIPYRIKWIRSILSKGDIILLNGGGNLGDLYPLEELGRRLVISSFPKTPIISFPQSITLAEPRKVTRLVKASQIAFKKKGRKLVLTARDHYSYREIKRIFPYNKVIKAADMVLLVNAQVDQQRAGVLLILRNDQESIIPAQIRDELITLLHTRYTNVYLSDMMSEKSYIDKTMRKQELALKLRQFQRAEIVVTDRLHGMIFAVITGTPCVVFDNYNSKIRHAYESWLGDYKGCQLVPPNGYRHIEQILIQMKRLKEEFAKGKLTFSKNAAMESELIEAINREIFL